MPNAILYDDELSSSSKLFFCCVSSHTAERGYSFASNAYFAKKMGVKPRQVQRWLEELKAYLFIDQRNGKRTIELYPGDLDEWGVSKKTRGGVKKDTHNNKSLINIKNKQKDSVTFGGSEKTPPTPPRELLQQIIEIVNPKEKVIETRLKDLNGRLREYTPEEIIAAAKVFSESEWHKENKQMSVDNLLRPSKFGRWYAQAQEQAEKAQGYVPPTPEEQAKIDEMNKVESWNHGDK